MRGLGEGLINAVVWLTETVSASARSLEMTSHPRFLPAAVEPPARPVPCHLGRLALGVLVQCLAVAGHADRDRCGLTTHQRRSVRLGMIQAPVDVHHIVRAS